MKNFTLLMFAILSLSAAYGQTGHSPVFNNNAFERSAASSRALVPILDSVQYWYLDSINLTSWDIAYRISNYAYDANNNITSDLWQTPGGGWQNYELENYTYTPDNLKSIYFQQLWYSGAWQNRTADTLTYNSNNLVIDSTQQTWAGGTSDGYTLYIITYNSNNLKATYSVQDIDAGVITNVVLDTLFTYNSSNEVTGYLEQEGTLNGWFNSIKVDYYYADNNNLMSVSDQEWNGSGWTNFDSTAYTYNSNNLKTSSVGLIWQSGAWVNYAEETYTYNSNNDVTRQTFLTWSGSDWAPDNERIFTYDANNILLCNVNETFDGEGDSIPMYDTDSIYYYFNKTAEGIKQLAVDRGQLTVYPNPTSGQFTVNLNNNPIGNTVAAYNIMGERVYQAVLSNLQNTISLSDEPDGMYFVYLKSGEGVEVGKVLVTK